MNSNVGPARGRNKLRLYKSFKHNYSVESSSPPPGTEQLAFSKFRCDVGTN